VNGDFEGRVLSGFSFRGADLTNAVFRSAILVETDFEGALLHGADFTDAELLGANLRGADLSRCSAARAGFGGADLTDSCLFEATLEDATLSGAILVGADLRAAQLSRARLRDADLTRASLTRAVAHQADLTGACLHRAHFDEANLRESRLRNVQGYQSATFLAADVRDIDFSGAYLLRRQILDENYLDELRRQSAIGLAAYWIWKVTSNCGRSITLWALWTAVITVGFGVAYQFVDIAADTPGGLTPYYFSLVTMTTLGYGDVLPASDAAQLLVMLEVLMGYLMLGGLLSLFASKMGRRAD
jgi:uncharacterized protein YjbI with pentapeptide repeats